MRPCTAREALRNQRCPRQNREVTTLRASLRLLIVIATIAVFESGCSSIPKDALRMSPESVEHRQLQTRRFDGTDDERILAAAAGVLQDLGFSIDESETKLGLIVASKDRSAFSPQQLAGMMLGAIIGLNETLDKTQKIRVALVARPSRSDIAQEDAKDFLVRVTFQRTIRDTEGKVTKTEAIDEAQIYQEFFDKLSKSLFLVANEI